MFSLLGFLLLLLGVTFDDLLILEEDGGLYILDLDDRRLPVSLNRAFSVLSTNTTLIFLTLFVLTFFLRDSALLFIIFLKFCFMRIAFITLPDKYLINFDILSINGSNCSRD